MDEAKTQSLEENRLLLTKTNKQTNENHPVGEKLNWLVSRQGRAGQGRTGWTRLDKAGQDTDDIKHYVRTHTELQTQGDFKGSK